MLKKLLVIILAVALVGTVALFPFSVTEQVEIESGFGTVAEQFSNNANLAKWFLPFANEPKEDVKIKTSGTTVLESAKASMQKNMPDTYSAILVLNKEKKAVFVIAPVTEDIRSSIVYLSYKTNYLNRFLRLNKSEKLFSESLKNLKLYMEDPLQFYGYEMKIVPVSDTTFLVTKTTARKEEITQKANALFEKLIAFAEKNNGGYTGVRIFHKERITGDVYDLSAGIGVTSDFPVLAAPGIEYKRMPFQKNLLVTTYTGLYGDIWKAYEAIALFKKENGLGSMAISFEKFPEGTLNFSDSEMVRVEIYYPIF